MKAKNCALYLDPRALRPMVAELGNEVSVDLNHFLVDFVDHYEQFQSSKLKSSNGDHSLLQVLQADLERARSCLSDPKESLKTFSFAS
jgi:hypothetical protein